ncbi:hypothetical protein [Pseudomonas rhizoryzae]|uniref:hypothetical protein n=1 Tax=Pseudomonas rhizoryzae TaxID=2571129 RepID=UPI0007371FA1|nr:hypothetical protein [Pseudomonas rhizoryzae]KTT08227.1 hypothetical protein NS2R_21665 [Pseudomonas psychrotolerans]KTT28609.1 hypothetical protein SB9_23020 [Pseudomonas psychrotolerans]KTT29055.1 hypothetical protein NS201_18160 [Pseudomonas psychrotolerans]KTT48847.1 hypothetical protein SB11R_13465 [Pseudomonas psychrotolerans]KTT63641.1 hypothetical protein NS383_19155 [Pseudomonas psychrotolerans]
MKHRYLIVDRTALDTPALFDYLAEAPQHRVIVSGGTAEQLFAADLWPRLRERLAPHAERFFFADSSGPLLQAELEGRKPGLLDRELTLAFKEAVTADAEDDRVLTRIRSELLDTDHDYQANRRIFLNSLLGQMRRALPAGAVTAGNWQDAIRQAIAAAQQGLAKGFAPGLADAPFKVFLKAYPLAARYVAQLAVLLITAGRQDNDVLIDRFVAQDPALVATLFDGLLSEDDEQRQAYTALKRTLDALGTGGQALH